MSKDAGESRVLSVGDLRPTALMGEWANRVAIDIEWLRQRQDRYEHVVCPACGVDDCVSLYEKNAVPHVSCRRCGTQYANPRPSEVLLHDFYVHSTNYQYWADHIYAASQEVRREKLFKPRVAYIAELVRNAKLNAPALVEVGAGYGLFCEEAIKTGVFSRVIGIEPTPPLAKVCRAKGLEVIEAGYEGLELPIRPDVIASYEVIEHLHSPEKFMAWCLEALNPGGYLVLTCPCISGFETLVQQQNSGTIDHQHINLFSTESLPLLARRVGFGEVAVETPGALDAELVKEGIAKGGVDNAVLGSFLHNVLGEAEPKVLAAFQEFLRVAGKTSHMRVVARKPAQ